MADFVERRGQVSKAQPLANGVREVLAAECKGEREIRLDAPVILHVGLEAVDSDRLAERAREALDQLVARRVVKVWIDSTVGEVGKRKRNELSGAKDAIIVVRDVVPAELDAPLGGVVAQGLRQ